MQKALQTAMLVALSALLMGQTLLPLHRDSATDILCLKVHNHHDAADAMPSNSSSGEQLCCHLLQSVPPFRQSLYPVVSPFSAVLFQGIVLTEAVPQFPIYPIEPTPD